MPNKAVKNELSVVERLTYWWWSKFELPKFYHHARALCGPPMMLLDEIEAGEIWFYDFAVRVLVCVGDRSIIIAYYYTTEGRDKVIADLRRIYEWLVGKAPRPSRRELEVGLVFAASEEPDGTIRAVEYIRGDWCGVFALKRLPDHDCCKPKSWLGEKEDAEA